MLPYVKALAIVALSGENKITNPRQPLAAK